MTAGRRHRTGQLPEAKAAIVAVSIRTLRQRNGSAQAELGGLMDWPNASTVCAAEGPPRWTAKGFHRQGSPATGRHLRRTLRAAHGAVREL